MIFPFLSLLAFELLYICSLLMVATDLWFVFLGSLLFMFIEWADPAEPFLSPPAWALPPDEEAFFLPMV